ncbi:MAG: sialate O-acetylesterase [Planctomycetota bacterium]
MRVRFDGIRWAGMLVLVAWGLILGGEVTVGEVRLPAVIGDNMVLQREMEVPIWGWAKPGEKVWVKADWLPKPVECVTDAGGCWRVLLKTDAAGGPHKIAIMGANTIELNNVLIGEVWVCSGQSNMEWSFKHGVDNGETETAAANHPRIRLFNVKRTLSMKPEAECEGDWSECSPESVHEFSAVAYFYGRELHRELDVPIGLIATNWGGTVAEAWTSAEALAELGDFDAELKAVARERDEPGTMQKQHDRQMNSWWQAVAQRDAGSRAGWMTPDLDDADWPAIAVPGPWQTADLKDFDGIAWLRTTVNIPAAWAEQELVLELGPIDDMDAVWLNGKQVGGVARRGYWYRPRKYNVPAAAIQEGCNVMAVRVFDLAGPGGLTGKPEQLRLYPAGSEGAAVPLAGQWRYRVGASVADLPPIPPRLLVHPNLPTVLYNGMIAPLVPYGMRGAIWYQGESNRLRARQYRTLFPRMIADWRQRWGQGDFPFYYCQIAPYLYAGDTGQAAELREAQLLSLATPKTGMVVTMDIGNPRDIHPRNKQEVGRRLALWALARTYGRADLVYSGPLYKSMKVEGARIRLSFEHVGGGLVCDGDALTHFVIAGADRRFVPAQARIDGATVVVWSDAVSEPVAVRYGWGTADQPNLKNREGLPASSFRTDDWVEAGFPPAKIE